tara:strand:+ start:220 stop:687 length:468 start_codon:yes stop_codon:yes gene_type:complete
MEFQFRQNISTFSNNGIIKWVFYSLVEYHNCKNYSEDYLKNLSKIVLEISKFVIDECSFDVPVEFFGTSLIMSREDYEDIKKITNTSMIYWDNRYYNHKRLYENLFFFENQNLVDLIYNNFSFQLSFYEIENKEDMKICFYQPTINYLSFNKISM